MIASAFGRLMPWRRMSAAIFNMEPLAASNSVCPHESQRSQRTKADNLSCKRGNRRRINQGGQRYVYVQSFFDQFHHDRCVKGISTKVTKVVVDADQIHFKHLCPNLREGPLDLITRGDVSAG